MARQTSMSYPGQGRPTDAVGSSQDKAAPDRPKGRSQPSTQENIPNKATASGKEAPASSCEGLIGTTSSEDAGD
jgi:hypothetical protein